MRKTLLCVSTFLVATAGAALADPASVATSCLAGGDCVALVKTEISNLPEDSASRDKGVADLVVALGQQSTVATRKHCEQMAAGVRVSADSVSSVDQRTRILEIANTMCTPQTVTASVANGPNSEGGDRHETAASAN